MKATTDATTQGAVYICDCGHPESKHSEITRGYGADKEGKTYCYECCTTNDKEALLSNNVFTGYCSGDMKHITNWPGRILGVITHVGAVHPWSRRGYDGPRYYISVTDCHGQKWHGTGAGGMWATLRKNKKRD